MDFDQDMEYAAHKNKAGATDDDLLRGSLGDYIDSHIGRQLADVPLGYTLEKFTYKKAFTGADSILATFRQDSRAQGFTYMTNGSTRTSAYLVPEADPAASGFTGENYMREGDVILGHVLRLNDKRRNDHAQGGFSAGVIAVGSGAYTGNNPYGITVNQDAGIINAYAVGGALHVPARRSRRVAVTGGLSYLPNGVFTPRLKNVDSDLTFDSAPVSAITLDSFNATSDAADVDAELTIYALVGARQIGGLQGTMKRSKTTVADLLSCQPATHVVIDSV
jgi:hypothetical protein